MKAIVDTNILIDYLNGISQARSELALYEDPSISLITWMEVMAGGESGEEAVLRDFLLRFRVASVDRRVAEAAVKIRRKHRLRLPDAIIWATAQVDGLILVTRNTRDFPPDHPGVRVPYQI